MTAKSRTVRVLLVLLWLGALVEVGLDVELGEECEEDQHEWGGDDGELPGVAALGDAEDDHHALAEHHGELETATEKLNY